MLMSTVYPYAHKCQLHRGSGKNAPVFTAQPRQKYHLVRLQFQHFYTKTVNWKSPIPEAFLQVKIHLNGFAARAQPQSAGEGNTPPTSHASLMHQRLNAQHLWLLDSLCLNKLPRYYSLCICLSVTLMYCGHRLGYFESSYVDNKSRVFLQL